MKKTFLIVVLLVAVNFILTQDVAASVKTESFFDREGFVKSVNEAYLLDHNALPEKVAPFLKVFRAKGIPNCFECSLYLIRTSLEKTGPMQLVAADLAVKLSPDLPEAHLHYFLRLIKFSPQSMRRISKAFSDTLVTFYNFPPRNAFFYSILNRISKSCIIFLIVLFIILFFKYPSAVAHRYMHLVGFSRFYAATLLVVMTVSSVVLILNQLSWLIVLLTFTIFFSGVSVVREKIILNTVFFICVAAEAAIILTGAEHPMIVDKEVAMSNLKGIYSPSSTLFENTDINAPGGSMARGVMFYYAGNYNRAAFYLKRELNTVSDKKIKASLDNFLGLSFARQGNLKEASEHLRRSYEETGNFNIGYNLSRVLYEGGRAGDAASLERHILENAGTISLRFPYHYYPEMYRTWRYVTTGKTGESLEIWIKFFLFCFAIILLYMVLLVVRFNYLRKIRLHKCLECGSIICSSCNPGANTTVCVVCRLIKAKPDLFKRGETEIYESKRNGYFARYSLFTTIFTFIAPGGGLIFSDRILEGSVYLFTIVFLLTQIFQSEWGTVYNISPDGSDAGIILSGIFLGLIYLVSILRGFYASRDV